MSINEITLINQASNLREQLGEDAFSPIDIFSLVQSIDTLTLILYPLGKNISGVCYKGDSSSAIIINSDMSLGRQRFSLAHELYHLFYDEATKPTVSLEKIGSGGESEKKADMFASYFLMPSAGLYKRIEKYKQKYGRNKLSIEEIIKWEQYYGVSHQAMLYRLQNEPSLHIYIDEEIKNVGVVSLAKSLGYSADLYLPSPKEKKILVLGHYVNQAKELLDQDKISCGKYEELLLDAFREDIVYGSEEEEYSFD
ncbi:ImmA/IrrE family metallo-endopeptidase [Peptococcus simiae]|uniref:ImmA/IrrE family metallo-endopeptidase n=1 Tax=Peptococcus simiae TaxID=1643805 RepID=UPI00397F7DFA